MEDQAERTSPPPPLPVRVIGKALTRMVARAPWTWPLLRRLLRAFFDRSASGWDERVRPDAPRTGSDPSGKHPSRRRDNARQIPARSERAIDQDYDSGAQRSGRC
jgi:hypothetical protein